MYEKESDEHVQHVNASHGEGAKKQQIVMEGHKKAGADADGGRMAYPKMIGSYGKECPRRRNLRRISKRRSRIGRTEMRSPRRQWRNRSLSERKERRVGTELKSEKDHGARYTG